LSLLVAEEVATEVVVLVDIAHLQLGKHQVVLHQQKVY
jgi:hypothetical protein